jgi:membrane-associated protease RseP (regulator of RpoE activity)
MELADNIIKLAVFFPAACLIVLTLHELGHYWAARALGVRVQAFSIGYGRIIRRWHDRRGTQWSLRLFPFGGHVYLSGHSEEGSGARGESFEPRPLAHKLVIVLAAPLLNFALPFFFILPFFALAGQPSIPPVLAGVEIGEVAERAGLRPGDRFVSINGKPVRRYHDVRDVTSNTDTPPVELVMERDGREFSLTLTPSYLSFISERGQKKETGRLGIMARHAPFALEALDTVAGQDVSAGQGRAERDAANEKARALITAHFGKDVVIGIKSEDRTIRDYLIRPSAANNKGFLDPGHEDYENFRAGSRPGNFYLNLSLPGAIAASGRETLRVIRGVTSVPFQLFPIDDTHVGPQAVIAYERAPVRFLIFRLLYMCAMISVMTGLVNLIPFPGLDGHKVLMMLTERFAAPERVRKTGAKLTVYILAILYLGVLAANIPDFVPYAQIRTQALAEWAQGL